MPLFKRRVKKWCAVCAPPRPLPLPRRRDPIPDPRSDHDFSQLAVRIHEMLSRAWDRPLKIDDYVNLIGLCTRLQVLPEGRQVHRHITMCRLQRNWETTTQLMRMYGVCGCPHRAYRCFQRINIRRQAAWVALIMAFAENAHYQEARFFFDKMTEEFVKPDVESFCAALYACVGAVCLEYGREIHAKIEFNRMNYDPVLYDALISMYGRCNAVDLAADVFEQMGEQRNVESWISMIAVYTQNGHLQEASVLTRKFALKGVMQQPSRKKFLELLGKCERIGERWKVEVIESLIRLAELEWDLLTRQELMKAYGRCQKPGRARQLFCEMKEPDPFMWATIIRVYVCSRNLKAKAFKLFEEMKSKGVKPTTETLFALLSACRTFEEAKLIHGSIVLLRGELPKGDVAKELIIRKYRTSQKVPDAWEKFRQLHARFQEQWRRENTGLKP